MKAISQENFLHTNSGMSKHCLLLLLSFECLVCLFNKPWPGRGGREYFLPALLTFVGPLPASDICSPFVRPSVFFFMLLLLWNNQVSMWMTWHTYFACLYFHGSCHSGNFTLHFHSQILWEFFELFWLTSFHPTCSSLLLAALPCLASTPLCWLFSPKKLIFLMFIHCGFWARGTPTAAAAAAAAAAASFRCWSFSHNSRVLSVV